MSHSLYKLYIYSSFGVSDCLSFAISTYGSSLHSQSQSATVFVVPCFLLIYTLISKVNNMQMPIDYMWSFVLDTGSHWWRLDEEQIKVNIHCKVSPASWDLNQFSVANFAFTRRIRIDIHLFEYGAIAAFHFANKCVSHHRHIYNQNENVIKSKRWKCRSGLHKQSFRLLCSCKNA